MTDKLWGGRFSKQVSPLVLDFHSSFQFDHRLFKEDIQGSIAHATMLGEQKIITTSEAEKLVDCLIEIEQEIEWKKLPLTGDHEDIHSFIEAQLIKRLGDLGKKLHSARSRNDQVVTDVRMHLRKEIDQIKLLLKTLIQTLMKLSDEHKTVIMPGYTHLQRAQPITLGHHLAAYIAMFLRDLERMVELKKRVNVLVLGSGALATSSYPLNRKRVAELLEFGEISHNSLDAVSDRDFAIEFCSHSALIMMHLSRLSEELILWSTTEFKFIELDDAFSTGSSMMPQKKNPDVSELTRGKTGRVYGNLISLLTLMKSLPLAYNKDLQEDKEALFDTIDTIKACLAVTTPLLSSLKVYPENMLKATEDGYLNATDLADFLARKGVPFREAHEIVGQAVRYAIEKKLTLEKIKLTQYKKWSPSFDASLFNAISIEKCISSRSLEGGPSVDALTKSLAIYKKKLTHLLKVPPIL